MLSNSYVVADAKKRTINIKGSATQRKEFLDSYRRIAILKDDVISKEEWELDISSLRHKVKSQRQKLNIGSRNIMTLKNKNMICYKKCFKRRNFSIHANKKLSL